jgi:NAD(P)-dependent dehydrogenase (short-subunit alcohol dehydrogenase family)
MIRGIRLSGFLVSWFPEENSFVSQQRVVLVTGGAKGVGRGITERFLAAGATVIVCGREAPEQLPSAGGRTAEFIPANVRDAAAVDTLFTQIAEKYGRLDVLVNNAGGAPFALASKASPRFHESIIQLNLIAPLNLALRANALMQAQPEGGVIVFVASISAVRPSPGTAAYGAAKAGVLSLVQSLAVEWAPKVRVVAVSPGLVKTEQSELHYGDEAGIAAVSATVPMGRMAEPADIGDACVWLSSPQAAYVSGSNLIIHGGGEKPAFLSAASVNKA